MHTLDIFELRDCLRIFWVLKNKGIELTTQEIANLWDKYSAARCAVWLKLPENDEELWLEIKTAIAILL